MQLAVLSGEQVNERRKRTSLARERAAARFCSLHCLHWVSAINLPAAQAMSRKWNSCLKNKVIIFAGIDVETSKAFLLKAV